MRSAWRLLSLAHSDASTPPLNIKYNIGTSDYSVWVTDLTLIWEEILDRKRIIQRSFSIDTSIDPSEGSDQLRLLLQSIERSLEQQKETTLSLVRDDNDGRLLLRAHVPLPGSLRPLNWVFELTTAPQSKYTVELVVPMLGHQVIANIEKASLVQQLKEKDQVIAKLTDKMQSDGMDLARVFPGVASSKSGRHNTRQVLGKTVKGLGEFDEQQWQSRLRTDAASRQGYPAVVPNAFFKGLEDLSDGAQISKYDKWWESLKDKTSKLIEISKESDLIREEGGSIQTDFQRQSTPPKIHTARSHSVEEMSISSQEVKRKARNRGPPESDSTTDESDSGSRSGVSKISPSSKSKASGNNFMGTSRAISPNPSTNVSNKNRIVQSEDTYIRSVSSRPHRDSQESAASSSDDNQPDDHREHINADLSSAIADANITEPSVPKPKAKLGRIGGTSKASKDSTSQFAGQGNATAPSSQKQSPLRLKTKDEAGSPQSVQDNTDASRLGRAQSKARVSSPRESSQDRANRKREQLKRELENKSHAGAKKKRKF